jgi:hypothetical protein
MTDKIGTISIRDSSGTVQTFDDTTNGGLNIYQIIPKVKQLVMSGECPAFAPAYSAFTGSTVFGGAKTIDQVTWGMSNNINNNLFFVKGFINSPVKLYYNYIDYGKKNYVNNESTAEINIDISGFSYIMLTNNTIVGINDVRLSRRLGTTETVRISNIQDLSNNIIEYTSRYYHHSIITCPNNAIMFVSNINANGPQNDIALAKYEANTGVRTTIFRHNLFNASHHFTAGYGGCLGCYMYPGDAVLMFSINNFLASSVAYANVVIKYLS